LAYKLPSYVLCYFVAKEQVNDFDGMTWDVAADYCYKSMHMCICWMDRCVDIQMYLGAKTRSLMACQAVWKSCHSSVLCALGDNPLSSWKNLN